MTTTSSPALSAGARAYKAFAEGVAAALARNDRDLTEAANRARRADDIVTARMALVYNTPPAVTRTITRADVLAARAPKTADAVALQARERQRVGELRAAGKSLADILAEASEERVAALADDLEALAARDANEAERVADALFDRLVSLGAEDAVTALAEEEAADTTAAWRTVLTRSAQGRDDVGLAWQDLYYLDPEGYAATHGAMLTVDHHNANRIAPPEVPQVGTA